jgi:hypothetical protein
VEWCINLQRRTEELNRKLDEIRAEMPRRIDPDWISFRALRAESAEDFLEEMRKLGATQDQIMRGVRAANQYRAEHPDRLVP